MHVSRLFVSSLTRPGIAIVNTLTYVVSYFNYPQCGVSSILYTVISSILFTEIFFCLWFAFLIISNEIINNNYKVIFYLPTVKIAAILDSNIVVKILLYSK